MACYLLKYGDTPVAASNKRLVLLVYVVQKRINRLDENGLSITRIEEGMMNTRYSDYILEHHETGYVATAKDVMAYDIRKEEDEMKYTDLLNGLKEACNELDDEKDIKKLEKAIKVLKDNAKKFVGKKHNISLMRDIVSISFADIVLEAEMFGFYRNSLVE